MQFARNSRNSSRGSWLPQIDLYYDMKSRHSKGDYQEYERYCCCCVLQLQDLSRMKALLALALVVVAVSTAEAAQ